MVEHSKHDMKLTIWLKKTCVGQVASDKRIYIYIYIYIYTHTCVYNVNADNHHLKY